jgi:hypothetical protein
MPVIECSRRKRNDRCSLWRRIRTKIGRLPRLAKPERTVFGAALVTALFVIVGCHSHAGASVVPVPALAGDESSQEAFHRIEARWVDGALELRATLEPELRAFLTRFPDDDRARTVELHLAWLELERGHTAQAEVLANDVRRGPPGAVHDFADVAFAAILRREGRFAEALALLEPLRGKIVDSDDRAVHSEELVRTLVALRKFGDAIVAMLDWADQAPASDRENAVASIQALIRETPTPALEAGLAALAEQDREGGADDRSTRSEARRWLYEAVRTRLERVALADRDPELARRLMESRRMNLGHEDVEQALSELADESSVAPRVAGRAIGVVLDVTDDAAKRRSAEVVAGMTRALGLPASASRPESVRLVTRDADERSDVERALAGLAGDGASILVAGVSDDSAIAASVFAERAHIPVIVLARPPNLVPGPFTFLLGESVLDAEKTLDQALVSLGSRSTARVGPGGASCDAVPESAGAPRFPVRQWKHDSVDTLVFLGDPECARDAALEAASAGVIARLLFGLDAGALVDVPGSKFVLSAGRFPFGSAPLSDEETAWVKRWGSPPSWYETLGHDAAVLGSAVLASFPLARIDDRALVNGLHQRARDGLLVAHATLWSTLAAGFDGKPAVQREFRVVPVPRAGSGTE